MIATLSMKNEKPLNKTEIKVLRMLSETKQMGYGLDLMGRKDQPYTSVILKLIDRGMARKKDRGWGTWTNQAVITSLGAATLEEIGKP